MALIARSFVNAPTQIRMFAMPLATFEANSHLSTFAGTTEYDADFSALGQYLRGFGSAAQQATVNLLRHGNAANGTGPVATLSQFANLLLNPANPTARILVLFDREDLIPIDISDFIATLRHNRMRMPTSRLVFACIDKPIDQFACIKASDLTLLAEWSETAVDDFETQYPAKVESIQSLRLMLAATNFDKSAQSMPLKLDQSAHLVNSQTSYHLFDSCRRTLPEAPPLANFPHKVGTYTMRSGIRALVVCQSPVSSEPQAPTVAATHRIEEVKVQEEGSVPRIQMARRGGPQSRQGEVHPTQRVQAEGPCNRSV